MTETVPEGVLVEKERLLPVIVTEDAFVVFQESTVDEPRVILVGDAAKEEIEGKTMTIPFVVALT